MCWDWHYINTRHRILNGKLWRRVTFCEKKNKMLSLSNSASPASNKELESDNVTLFPTVNLKFGLIKAYALAGLPNKQPSATERVFIHQCDGYKSLCSTVVCVRHNLFQAIAPRIWVFPSALKPRSAPWWPWVCPIQGHTFRDQPLKMEKGIQGWVRW